MLKKWFSKSSKNIEETPVENADVEEPEEGSLESQSGWIIYTVDDDGLINMDFDFNNDYKSNENFSELFHQLNKGDLLENGLSFIKKTLELQGRESDLKDFNENTEILNKVRGNIFLDLLTQGEEEVVVKPTDIAKNILKDEHK